MTSEKTQYEQCQKYDLHIMTVWNINEVLWHFHHICFQTEQKSRDMKTENDSRNCLDCLFTLLKRDKGEWEAASENWSLPSPAFVLCPADIITS